jgi:hypothetical protein
VETFAFFAILRMDALSKPTSRNSSLAELSMLNLVDSFGVCMDSERRSLTYPILSI